MVENKRRDRVARVLDKAFNEHFVQTMVVATLVIISMMLAIHFITYKPERYTGFGLLNDIEEAGPFPANVSYNAPLHLHSTVLNHEGKTELFRVNIIVGDASTMVDPVLGVVGGTWLASFDGIAAEGQEWRQGVTLQFNETLVGYKKIFFDLWILVGSSFTFKNQTLHIWVNILGP